MTAELGQQLIINADDLGYSASVNRAVDTAMGQGWLRSATLMANAPGLEEGVAISERHRGTAGFGVHLNLTEFPPLSDGSALRQAGLLGEEGAFAGTIRQVRSSRDLQEACFRELDCQVQRVRALGVPISHFDSHHHVHTIPWLLPVIHQLQKQHGVWKLRNTMNVYGRRLHARPPLRRVLGKTLWRSAVRLRGSRMPAIFTGLDVFLEEPGHQAFRRARTIELMCHPGQEGYDDDLDQLRRCRDVADRTGCALASFEDLALG